MDASKVSAASRSKLSEALRLVREAKRTLKHEGFRGFVRKYGWKIVFAIFLFYLIRDLIIYVLLPWLVLREIF